MCQAHRGHGVRFVEEAGEDHVHAGLAGRGDASTDEAVHGGAFFCREDKGKKTHMEQEYTRVRRKVAERRRVVDAAQRSMQEELQAVVRRHRVKVDADLDKLDEYQHRMQDLQWQARRALKREVRHVQADPGLTPAHKQARVDALVQQYRAKLHPDDDLTRMDREAHAAMVAPLRAMVGGGGGMMMLQDLPQ